MMTMRMCGLLNKKAYEMAELFAKDGAKVVGIDSEHFIVSGFSSDMSYLYKNDELIIALCRHTWEVVGEEMGWLPKAKTQ